MTLTADPSAITPAMSTCYLARCDWSCSPLALSITTLTFPTSAFRTKLSASPHLPLRPCLCLILLVRDLKPENLIMTSDDNNADLKVVDFGFAAIDTGGMSCLSLVSGCLL